MIGLDTNVILRHLMRDDEAQSALALRLFQSLTPEAPGFVSGVTTSKVSLAMARSFRSGRQVIAKTIEGLLYSSDLVFENPDVVARALLNFCAGRSVDFSDALIAEAARLAGASTTVTFDRVAASEAGMTLLA